jgi:hypothetical protein
MDNIGKYAPDGSIAQWPQSDIHGAAYERGNGSIADIGNGQFVVLPIGFIDNGVLEGLRAENAPKAPLRVRKEALSHDADTE